MVYVIMLIAAIGIATYYLLRSSKKDEPAPDAYVCNVCGKKDCICNKVEAGK